MYVTNTMYILNRLYVINRMYVTNITYDAYYQLNIFINYQDDNEYCVFCR